MGEHDHDHGHEHAARQTRYGDLDPAETAKLKEEAHKNAGSTVGYFLAKAAECEFQSERVFWLGKVDSARYFAERKKAKAKLDASARRNMEADERLEGGEASLVLDKVVGNACIVRLVPGKGAPGGYSLIRRKAGETGTTDHGPPMNMQWVVQGLDMNIVHEFAVVSKDSITAKSVQGPWLAVPIGNVSTDEIQNAEQVRAQEAYAAHEAEEARKAEEHAAKVAADRAEHSANLKRQQEEADRMNAIREKELQEKMEAHEKAVAELPLVKPRDLDIQIRDNGKAGMVADIFFRRGEKKPKIYQFGLNDTVLGYPPDGRYSGRKADGHVYLRTVPVPKGRVSTIRVYGVTDHGDGEETREVSVPHQLSYRSGFGNLLSGDVGGGRFGFAARTFTNWGVSEVDGWFSAAQETGVVALFQSAGDAGIMWLVAAHDRVESVVMDGVKTPVSKLTYLEGAGHLFKGDPEKWPAKDWRASKGVTVEIECRSG